MQVSQMSDAVTHAVLGKQSSVEMGVSDSAALMHIFSTTLYTYPKLATVREIICNGWDGHITSGRTDTPLQITISETSIVIRDFGPGIPHDKIGPIYGVFGNSTKREDGSVTGGFGLGSKAPFSYTDNFEVVSNNNGLKSVYRISKSSMEKGGKPSIDTMVQIPTEETGIRVTIPLKHSHDRVSFIDHIKEVLVLGEIRAVINEREEEVAVLPLSESPTGYVISSFHGTLTTQINLRYGNVVYPVPRMDHYGEMWDQVRSNMSKLWNGANITFMAEPDTISIAPSREALIFTDGTVDSIKQLLSKFNPAEAKTSPIMTRQLNMSQANKIILEEKPAHRPDMLNQQLRLPVVKGTSLEHESGPYAFKLRKAAINHAISQRSLILTGDGLILKRAHQFVHKSPNVDKTVGKKFLKAARQYYAAQRGRMNLGYNLSGRNGILIDQILQAPLMKYITSPLLAAVRANTAMDVEMLTYVDQNYRHTSNLRFVHPAKKTVGGIEHFMAFLFKRVLLARSKTAIKQFFDKKRWSENELMQEGWVVYQLPKSDKHYEAITKTFTDLGYEVHSYVPARAERTIDPDAPVKEAAVRKASPKRKGYLTLDSSKDWEGKFLVNTARENCKPEDHVVDPIAYVVLNSASQNCDRFSDFSEKSAHKVNQLWGKQIAVVLSTQVEKLQAKGIPEVSKYVHQFVDDKLSSAPDFPRYLAFAKEVKGNRDYPEGRDGILRYMLGHDELTSTLGFKFRFGLSVETEALVTFFEDDTYHGSRKKLTKCLELSKKVPVSKLVSVLRKRVAESDWQLYVNLDAVGSALRHHLPGSQKLAIPYEIVRNLLKEGTPK